ncbi:MAG: DoxX family protein [Bowdeniella nasicola]|nr:DoxX family protein [Bowdeniella nasicola]
MLLTTATLALSAMLIASGIGKLTSGPSIGATMAQWGSLKVPRPLVNRHLVRAHPWVELVLALLIWLPGPVGTIGTVISAVLVIVYTIILIRGIRSGIAERCSCFGDNHRITWYSVLRNVGFFLFAIRAIADHRVGMGGPVAAIAAGRGAHLLLALVLVIAGVLVVIGMSHVDSDEAQLPAATTTTDGNDEYQPMPLLHLPLRRETGELAAISELVSDRPVLLINVSTTCAKCAGAIQRLDHWQDRLGELVTVAVLTASDLHELVAMYPAVHGRVYWDHLEVISPAYRLATPSAILLGIDYTISGGPVHGMNEIDSLVEQMRNELIYAGVLEPTAPVMPTAEMSGGDTGAQPPSREH